MKLTARGFRQRPFRALLSLSLTLLALALLWPPGPYRTFAQTDEPPLPAPAAGLFVAYLPLVEGGGGVAPDLRFAPDAIELAPGGVTQVTVTVAPQADLRGASFDLPEVQDGVISSFSSGPDGMQGTLIITASEALEADERMLNVQGRSGVDSGKTWVGALKVKTTAPLTAKTIYADAVNGKDTNGGAQFKPFKTLTKALSVAVSGDTVKLLPGGYSKQGSGDTYPITVPNGVTIVGTLASNGAKQTFLSASSSGTGETGLRFAGDATVKNLEFDVFGTAMEADKGKLTLTNLNFILNFRGIQLDRTAQATVNNPYMFLSQHGGMSMNDQAQLTLNGGTFENVATCSSVSVIEAFGSSAFHVKDAVFKAFHGQVIRLATSARGDITNSQFTPSNDTCGGNELIDVSGEAHLKLTAVTSNGIAGRSSGFLGISKFGTVEADRLTVSNYSSAINAGELATLTLTNSTLSTNKNALRAGVSVRLTVSSSVIIGNEVGIEAYNLKLRGSRVVGGRVGIEANSPLVNLGDFTTAGNNTFIASSETSVRFQPGEPAVELFAVGNTWNKNTQFTTEEGRYTIRLADSQGSLASGRNFQLKQPIETVTPIKIRFNF